MVTTIQISEELKERLALRKQSNHDRYEDIIWDLLEDPLELSEQTKRGIMTARKEISEGQFVTHAQLKKELGL